MRLISSDFMRQMTELGLPLEDIVSNLSEPNRNTVP